MVLSHKTAVDLIAGGGAKWRKITRVQAVAVDFEFDLEVRGSTQHAVAGDYLCIDAEGQPYVCSASVFEKSYRPVGKVTTHVDTIAQP